MWAIASLLRERSNAVTVVPIPLSSERSLAIRPISIFAVAMAWSSSSPASPLPWDSSSSSTR